MDRVLLKYIGKLKEPRQVYAPFPHSGEPVIFNPFGLVPREWVQPMIGSGKFVVVKDEELEASLRKKEPKKKGTSPKGRAKEVKDD